jgi:pyruvate dehydrogenase E2 component (dihydrolipoamide acetyltransferase)
MDIIMPKMGESVNEGTIIKWHKKVGDVVKLDEIIFEISTDKVDTEIPAASAGVLSEILIKGGDTVEVGTVVARIQVSDESTFEIANVVEEKVISENNSPKISEPVQDSSTNGNIIEIAMPKMGESVMEGTIIKWHKKVGDIVKKDEMIFEISTDKVDTEIPSPEAGTLAEILVGEQETVDVGVIVARLAVGGSAKVSQRDRQDQVQVQEQVQEVRSMHDNFSKPVDYHLTEKGSGNGFFSPLVLSIAQKENISFDELQSIEGTGLESRVTKKDVLAYIEQRKNVGSKVQERNPEKTKFVQTPTSTLQTTTDVEKIPMDNIRQRIMDHMVHSRDTSVHVTELMEVDMTRIHNFINTKKDEILNSENAKITYMAFIADAVVKSLKKYPLVNSSIDGNIILKKKFINLGIAVAVEPQGLIVPNIKNAGDKNVIGLAKSISDIANRARTKKLTPDDISNGTFTITNYGVFGTIFGTPIINQPEVAILGVGAVQKKPVVIEVDGSDTIAIRNIMALTLSHDHRLVDGMLGGMFLKNIKEVLENFENII